MAYDLIIFDCDGTLVDSERYNNDVTSDILMGLGLKEYTPDACFNFFEGRSWTEIKPMLKEKHGDIIPDNIIDIYIQRVQEGIHTLKPMNGALEVIQEITQTHNKICVASNGERANVLAELEVTGIARYILDHHTFTKVQVKRGKPAPDLFLFAAAQMGVSPEKCLVIEDSVAGVQAGVAAGMDVIGFTGTIHDPETSRKKLLEAGAKHIISNLIHISDYSKS